MKNKDLTLAEVLGEYLYDDTIRAYGFKDIPVIKTVDCEKKKWPGKEKYVYVWYVLANGYAVGFNENPCMGYSFPVIKLK